MENKKEMLLEFAVKLLNRTDPLDIETVNLDVTNYGDSSTVQITIEYPADDVEDEDDKPVAGDSRISDYVDNE